MSCWIRYDCGGHISSGDEGLKIDRLLTELFANISQKGSNTLYLFYDINILASTYLFHTSNLKKTDDNDIKYHTKSNVGQSLLICLACNTEKYMSLTLLVFYRLMACVRNL